MIYPLPVINYFYDDKLKKYSSFITIVLTPIEEEWKVFYFRNKRTGYEISNMGRVRRPDGDIAKLYYDKDGYTRFCLYIPKDDPTFKNKKAIRYPYKTHRAVAELFVVNDNPSEYNIVMHRNDIPDCNVYLNLMWGTPKMNMDDKFYSGRSRYLQGEEKPDSKFTQQDVRDICNCIYNLDITTANEIIKHLGYEDRDPVFLKSFKNLISNIKRKHCWKFIIQEYEK